MGLLPGRHSVDDGANTSNCLQLQSIRPRGPWAKSSPLLVSANKVLLEEPRSFILDTIVFLCSRLASRVERLWDRDPITCKALVIFFLAVYKRLLTLGLECGY